MRKPNDPAGMAREHEEWARMWERIGDAPMARNARELAAMYRKLEAQDGSDQAKNQQG
jgi:hypothetical protein